MSNLKDVARHELIGKKVEVTQAENPCLVGIKGKVIDETMNTLTLECEGKKKRLIKSQIKFKMKIGEKILEMDGKIIVGRPEDRIKRVRRVI